MNLFSFIKGHISIVTVISEYVTLKKAGLYWKSVCPFHYERTPSFSVSPHKEIFYCFGCHEGGDVISFISKAEQQTPLEAAYYLADRYNIDIPETLKTAAKEGKVVDDKSVERKHYWRLCHYLGLWLHDQLLKNSSVLHYLADRKIDKGSIKKFRLGYFPSGLETIQELISYMQKNNFLLQDLLAYKILAEGKSVLYSSLADRIIFPIHDHLGRPCGFGGRTYKTSDERPKYYNSAENAYFLKGSLLFGFDLAKKNIQETGRVLLVEGYMDCITMVQHNFSNTVATLGTACTVDQLKNISRYAQELYVIYDADRAGHNAMIRLTELCWQVNLDLKIVQLPPNDDPDSFLSSGGNLKLLIEQAQDIFIFFIESLGKDFLSKNLNEKVIAIRSLIDIIEKIDDQLKKDILMQRASKLFDIPLKSLNKELVLKERTNSFSHQNGHKNNAFEKPSTSVHVLDEISILEKKLFSVIIINIMLVKKEDEEYLLEYFCPQLRDLFQKLILMKNDPSKSTDFTSFFDQLDEEEKILTSKLMLECQEYEGPENIDYLLTQFQKKNWKSFVTNTKIKLNRADKENNRDDAALILKNFQEVKQKLLRRGLI